MEIITRFAPSPTGLLHIGSLRTALFNFLYARRYGGKFFLRIEDTDTQRSTKAAIQQIIDVLRWMRLDWDEPMVLQSRCCHRHIEVGQKLAKSGMGYWCHCTPERLQNVREQAKIEKRRESYDRHCRDLNLPEIRGSSILRLKAPLTGEVHVQDLLKGDLTLQCKELDDMVLLRSNGTPTYMLAVVVDDHDMNITHIIRGDDHLTNAFRQTNLYHALEWEVPKMVHIPLIHTSSGAKLSKRNGDEGVEHYKDLGILPEALESTLLRLGWAHGDEEKITRENALKWFDVDGLSSSPARFDHLKLLDLNKHYIQHMSLEDLWKASGVKGDSARGIRVLPELRKRARTMLDITETLALYVNRDIPSVPSGLLSMMMPTLKQLLVEFASTLPSYIREEKNCSLPYDWSEPVLKAWVEKHELKLSEFANALRVVLLGKTVSIGIFHVLDVLGPEWVKFRIELALR